MQITIHQFLGTHLVEKLLKQEHRYADRDSNDNWQEFDNFGDFYAKWKHMFVVAFSTPEVLAARIIRTYVIRQVASVIDRSPIENPDEQALNEALDSSIASTREVLLEVLKTKWPKEWADIVARNAKPMMF